MIRIDGQNGQRGGIKYSLFANIGRKEGEKPRIGPSGSRRLVKGVVQDETQTKDKQRRGEGRKKKRAEHPGRDEEAGGEKTECGFPLRGRKGNDRSSNFHR